jgi:hypothetical protein
MERGDKKRKGKYKMKKNSTEKNRELSIAIVWHIDDVLQVRPELSREQAFEVLKQAKRYHDANVGINWEVLATHAEMLFAEREEDALI